MNIQDKIFTAGHRCLIGSALVQNLREQGYIYLLDRSYIDSDLTEEAAVVNLFTRDRPDYTLMVSDEVMADVFFRRWLAWCWRGPRCGDDWRVRTKNFWVPKPLENIR